jgi:hypothetical protein
MCQRRDKDKLGHSFQKIAPFNSRTIYILNLWKTQKFETSEINFRKDMDIELASTYQKKLF